MRRSGFLLLLGWLAAALAFTFWVVHDDVVLRNHLRHIQFWFLEAEFAVLIALSVPNVIAYARTLGLTRVDYAAIFGAAAIAVAVAGAVAPLTNRIFFDEQIYQGIAQNLSDLHLAQMCNDGVVEYGRLECFRGEYNKQPYGYPYLLSLVYRAGGVSYWSAARFNLTCAAIVSVICFLIARGLFSRVAAGAAALILALIPQQALWSHTAAAEPSAAAAAALAMLGGVHFVRTRTTAALAWFVVATAFAAQFRTESILIVALAGALVAWWAPEELRRVRFWGWVLIGACLSASLLAHLVVIRNDAWGSVGDRFSVQYLSANLRTNGLFYLWDWRFPAMYTALAIFGAATVRPRRAALFCALYFTLFWGVYLFFYAGSYNYGADVRYSLMTYPPLALLAGAGVAELFRLLGWSDTRSLSAMKVTALILVAQFLWYVPLVRATGEEAWAARADVAFAERMVPKFARNSIVLTHNPSLFHVMGMNAAQLSIAVTEPNHVSNVLLPRYAGGVFLHWNFWCNVADETQRAFCRSANDRFVTRLVGEHRERDYRFAFYRVEGVAPHQPATPQR